MVWVTRDGAKYRRERGGIPQRICGAREKVVPVYRGSSGPGVSWSTSGYFFTMRNMPEEVMKYGQPPGPLATSVIPLVE